MYSLAPVSANNDPYKTALRQYNQERAEEAIAAAKAATAAARAAAAAARAAKPPPPPEGRARRAINWLKRNVFCCCVRGGAAEAPVEEPVEEPPVTAVIPEPVTELPEGYFVGFDGKLMKPFDPTSGAPCPHYLATTNSRTGVKSCLNCKAEV